MQQKKIGFYKDVLLLSNYNAIYYFQELTVQTLDKTL